MANLQELTGRESGILLFDGREAIMCNWSSYVGIPRIFCGSLIDYPSSIPDDVEGEHTDNLLGILAEVGIYNFIEYPDDEELPKSGTLYTIDNCVVITPDDWC